MMKIENIRTYVWIEFGIWFILLCLVIGGIRLYRYHHFKELNSYQIFLQDADSLIVGSPVKYMGVQVGYIDKIKLVSNNVYVKFTITDKAATLPKGVIAGVEFSGMGGSKSLELYPPTEQSLASDKVIYIDRPKRLHDALNLLNDMYEKLSSITLKFSSFTDETGTITNLIETKDEMNAEQINKNFKVFEQWVNQAYDKKIKEKNTMEVKGVQND